MENLLMTRRELLAATAALSIAYCLPASLGAAVSSGEMPQRILGKTGIKVSILGLGGYHIGKPSDDAEGIGIIRAAIDNGITFMDNCWDYNDGASEIRMGKALRDGYREKVFLMTKIDGRTKEAAARQIDESLRRLQTDRIDLLQFHEVIRESDPRRIFAESGAMEAVREARTTGKIRFIGFTGHKSPDRHLQMLQAARDNDITFDAVQMPLNVMDAHFSSFEKRVLPLLVKERIAVLGMKPLADGSILKSSTATPRECLHYAMSLPTSVVITGCESKKILDQALQAARSFRPLDERQVDELLAKTAKAATEGRYEPYKTGIDYDSTSRNPEWLG